MSFKFITKTYQEHLDAFKNSPITPDVMDEVREILLDYCFDIEQMYGVSMSFKVWVGENDTGLKYEVHPDSELDAVLLKHVTENIGSTGFFSSSLH